MLVSSSKIYHQSTYYLNLATYILLFIFVIIENSIKMLVSSSKIYFFNK